MNNEYFDIYKFMYNLNLFINLLLNLESDFNNFNIYIFKQKNYNTTIKYKNFLDNLSTDSKINILNYFKKIYKDIKDKDFNNILKYFNDYLKNNKNYIEIYIFFINQLKKIININIDLTKNLDKNISKINIDIENNVSNNTNNANSNNINHNNKLLFYLVNNLKIFSININNYLSNQLLKLINKNNLTKLFEEFTKYLNNFIKDIDNDNFLIAFFNVNLHFFKILILSNLYFIVNYSAKDFFNDRNNEPLNNYFVIYNRLKYDEKISTNNLKVRFIRRPYTSKEMLKSISNIDMINDLNNLTINDIDIIGKNIIENIDKNIINNEYIINTFLNTKENCNLIKLIQSNSKYLFPFFKNIDSNNNNNSINDNLIKLTKKLNNSDELLNLQYIEKNILILFIMQILKNNIQKINKDDNNDIVDILKIINDTNMYYLNIFLSDKEYSYIFKNKKEFNINFFEGIEYNFFIDYENELIKYNSNFNTNGIRYIDLIKQFKNQNNIRYIDFNKCQLSINPNSFDYSFRIINLINTINDLNKLKKLFNFNNNILDEIFKYSKILNNTITTNIKINTI